MKKPMKKTIKKIRHKIAYWLAPDWIGDLEMRLSTLLCEATGGFLSKPYYTTETMVRYVQDYRERKCEECEFYLRCMKLDEVGSDGA